jgi:hypothetical protein
VKSGFKSAGADRGECFVIDSMWVFAVFGCLAAAALVASQLVRRRDIRRRHEEALRLTRQARREHDRERRQGDVPTQREVAEDRERHRSRDS